MCWNIQMTWNKKLNLFHKFNNNFCKNIRTVFFVLFFFYEWVRCATPIGLTLFYNLVFLGINLIWMRQNFLKLCLRWLNTATSRTILETWRKADFDQVEGFWWKSDTRRKECTWWARSEDKEETRGVYAAQITRTRLCSVYSASQRFNFTWQFVSDCLISRSIQFVTRGVIKTLWVFCCMFAVELHVNPRCLQLKGTPCRGIMRRKQNISRFFLKEMIDSANFVFV